MFTVTKKSSQAVFEQIKFGLRGEIESGYFKPGDALPDEKVLAAQLHVSHMTVRRAIVELTRDGLLKRISGKGTFVRDGFAPQPRTRKGSIALLSNGMAAQPAALSYYRLQQAVMVGLEAIGTPIVFRSMRDTHSETAAMLRQDASLRGVILIWGCTELEQELSKLSIPTVVLDGMQAEQQIFDEVRRDGESGVYSAVNYLINLGHRDIGFMHGDMSNSGADQRQLGYTRALAAHGIPVRTEFVYPVIHWWDAAFAATRRLLKGPQAPTALVCSADVMALGVMAAVTEHGWRVPKDISVVGFGDEGYFTVPQLSTVRVPLEQMGMRAAQMLAERLERPTMPLQRSTFQTEWISRASCDCPRI